MLISSTLNDQDVLFFSQVCIMIFNGTITKPIVSELNAKKIKAIGKEKLHYRGFSF